MLGHFLFTSLPVLFSLTLFLSAGLLFLVELMIAKMILPLLGGTPAVWNTCMMFFQAVLLARATAMPTSQAPRQTCPARS